MLHKQPQRKRNICSRLVIRMQGNIVTPS